MTPLKLLRRGQWCVLMAVVSFVPIRVAAEDPRVPFPSHVVYAGENIPPTNHSQAQLDEDVRALYTHWKAQYLKQAGTDGQGRPLYRVTLGKSEPAYTVSEGQGYGMIIVAHLAGDDPEA